MSWTGARRPLGLGEELGLLDAVAVDDPRPQRRNDRKAALAMVHLDVPLQHVVVGRSCVQHNTCYRMWPTKIQN
jgi:hypothetical protein